MGPDNLELRMEAGEELMKVQSVPLVPVMITTLTSATRTVLRTQDVQAMLDSRHLTMEFLHGRFMLMERLGLLHHCQI